MRRFFRSLVVLCAPALIAPAVSQATPINYGDFLGSAPGEVDFLQVTEDSATDATPLYDAPIHLTNKLVFTPLGFAASSTSGSSDTTNGVLTLRVRADAGAFLNYILIREIGDYTLFGSGGGQTSANILGAASALDLTPGTHGTMNAGLSYTPSPVFTLPSNSFAEFSGLAVINLSGLGISEIFLTLDNSLFTTSEPGTTSFIQKKNISIEAADHFIPEPATIALLIIGASLSLRRRRIAAVHVR